MNEKVQKPAGQQPGGEPEKLDLRSHDIAADKREELLRLFPEARTEDAKIDFDRLRLALGDTVDVGKERYGLTWPGKADCFRTIQTPSLGTLRPCPEESVDFDATQNLIIEGDNLEVLKLLQKSYLGKVKMIYIDPPYNTGNDFIYPDDYTESLQTYLEFTGQVDAQGKRFGTNTDTEGRFHSKWISMMYPRLYLARNLLREDGIIFVSIDDGELRNLRSIMDEIFGEEHFLASIAWEKRYTRSNNAQLFYSLKDTILAYRRSETVRLLREPRTDKSRDIYSNPDDDPRGDWTSSSYVNPARKEARPNLVYPITNPVSGQIVEHPSHAWKYERKEHERHVREQRLWWGKNGEAKYPRLKNFLSEMPEGIVPVDVWDYESTGTTDEGGLEVKEIFGEAVFDNPKPTRLIQRMIALATSGEGSHIVLDFFAGSGSTGHAVMKANHADGGDRRSILVQLPEPTGRMDFETIADILKERMRRVAAKIDKEEAEELPLGEPKKQDRGFRVFKLGESNFKLWNAGVEQNEEALATQLDLHIDHVVDGRSREDILYELLLKSGFAVTTPVEEVEIEGRTVYSVTGGAFIICLEPDLSLGLIRGIAKQGPERVVLLDQGFLRNDQLKANAAQIFRNAGVASFRTV